MVHSKSIYQTLQTWSYFIVGWYCWVCIQIKIQSLIHRFIAISHSPITDSHLGKHKAEIQSPIYKQCIVSLVCLFTLSQMKILNIFSKTHWKGYEGEKELVCDWYEKKIGLKRQGKRRRVYMLYVFGNENNEWIW